MTATHKNFHYTYPSHPPPSPEALSPPAPSQPTAAQKIGFWGLVSRMGALVVPIVAILTLLVTVFNDRSQPTMCVVIEPPPARLAAQSQQRAYKHPKPAVNTTLACHPKKGRPTSELEGSTAQHRVSAIALGRHVLRTDPQAVARFPAPGVHCYLGGGSADEGQ